MDKNQLAAWRAETMSKSIAAEKQAAQAAEQKAQAAAPAFFTGKPYLPATATYAFKYRDYAPSLARWTSEDPSGFPDGANSSYYAPSPTSQIDYQGLSMTVIIKEFYYDKITNYFSHDQMRISVGMDPTLVFNIRRAAYQDFKNSIALAYSVGDEIVKGQRVSVQTGIVADSAQLRAGYPKSKLTSIGYSDTTAFSDVGFTFNAHISSQKTYSYE